MTFNPSITRFSGFQSTAPPANSVYQKSSNTPQALQFGAGGGLNLPNPDRTLAKALVSKLNKARDGENIVIGRDPKLDFVLPEKQVSRTHAQFFKTKNQFYIQDLGTPVPDQARPGSTNGTWFIDHRNLIPYPIDLRGPRLKHPTEGRPLERTISLENGFSRTYDVRTDSKPHKIHNGDFIFIQGHILPIENLNEPEPGIPTRHPQAIEIARGEVKTLLNHLNKIKEGLTPTTDVQVAELMQIRLLLNRDIRFAIYHKLIHQGLQASEANQLTNEIRVAAIGAMGKYEGKIHTMMPVMMQSIVDIRELDSQIPDSFPAE